MTKKAETKPAERNPADAAKKPNVHPTKPSTNTQQRKSRKQVNPSGQLPS